MDVYETFRDYPTLRAPHHIYVYKEGRKASAALVSLYRSLYSMFCLFTPIRILGNLVRKAAYIGGHLLPYYWFARLHFAVRCLDNTPYCISLYNRRDKTV